MSTHLRRAFTWNLSRVSPTAGEAARLEAAGVRDPAAQRYAVWRRSLLLVALPPSLALLAVSALDAAEDGFGDLAPMGLGLEAVWWLAAVGLTVACARGATSWTRPGSGSRLLRLAWLASFFAPILYAMMPDVLLYRAEPAVAGGTGTPARLDQLLEIVLTLLRSAGPILLLLPGVLAVIPGAVNGCLRVKALLPAAQLPGWLLVCAAPMFLLLWIVLAVLVNQPVQSLLLVAGVLLWAGSPIAYAVHGRLFVRSGIGDAEIRDIARVKRIVSVVGLAGIALVVVSLFTARVAGLPLLGTDAEGAVTTRLEGIEETDAAQILPELDRALGESKSFAYAFDLSSWQLLIDVLARLLLATAVFADLALRATLHAWRNEREFRAAPGTASPHDAAAGALTAALTS